MKGMFRRYRFYVLLLVFVLVFTFSINSTLAKYKSSVKSSSGSSVANYSFEVTPDSNVDKNINYIKNSTDYTIKVSNVDKNGSVSEVSQGYVVKVTFNSSKHSDISIKLDNMDPVSNDGKTFIFKSSKFVLSSNIKQVNTHKVVFSLKGNSSLGVGGYNTSVSISVESEQID